MLVKSKVKYIQSLGHKKHRDEAAVFIAEGPKIVAELLQSMQVLEVFALPQWIDENKPLLKQVEATVITAQELEKISQLSTPNQVLAVVKKNDHTTAVIAREKLTLVLDTIQDPGNMGTLLRTADWFGLSQVVCSHSCADIYNPKVVQASMGSIARVRVLYTDLEQWLKEQQDARIYGAVLEGQDVTQMKKLSEGILVIGNESQGISREILQLVNVKITIPQKGKAESLNAAVAAGIILSHLTT